MTLLRRVRTLEASAPPPPSPGCQCGPLIRIFHKRGSPEARAILDGPCQKCGLHRMGRAYKVIYLPSRQEQQHQREEMP